MVVLAVAAGRAKSGGSSASTRAVLVEAALWMSRAVLAEVVGAVAPLSHAVCGSSPAADGAPTAAEAEAEEDGCLGERRGPPATAGLGRGERARG